VTGFNPYFTVWDIQDCQSFANDTSLKKTLGLRGQPVVAARFLVGSNYIAAVDVKGTIRTWNFKSAQLVQTIKPEFANTKVQGLLVFSSARFVVLSRRLTFYNTVQVSDAPVVPSTAWAVDAAITRQRNSHVLAAQDCRFCTWTNKLVCLTPNNLRIYNAQNGKLDSLFTTTDSEMTCMTLNAQHRKLYIGDSKGTVTCFNAVTLKEIGALRTKGVLQGIQVVSPYKESPEMLLAVSEADRIKVWYDKCLTEVKSCAGVSSHLKDDVTCQDFNERLSLVATGTAKGVLQLWDFEQLRLIAATQQTTFALTCLSFAPCSPLLVQTS
jgi:WD40 repeat protein